MHRWVQASLVSVLVGATSLGAVWVGGGDLSPVAQVQDPWSDAGEPPAPYGFGYGNATPDPRAARDDGPWPEFAEPAFPTATPAPPASGSAGSSSGSGSTSGSSSEPAQQPTVRADPVAASEPVAAPTIVPVPVSTAAADPLAAVQEQALAAQEQAAGQPAAVAEVNLATFNVLGSTHTEAGGKHPEMASGVERVEGVRELLTRHDVSVVGLQEFLPDQRRAFVQRVPGWEMYPALGASRRAGENSVAWRADTWDLVQAEAVQVPDAYGVERPMPLVLLRHRASGLKTYVSTFHNPADTRRHHHQEKFREAAEQRQVQLFRRLEGTGIPQLVTGDMNERGDYFCAVTSATTLTTPAGGSNDGTCKPPEKLQLDWIFGSPEVEWTDYVVDDDALVRRTSDHPFVTAGARLDPADFPRALN